MGARRQGNKYRQIVGQRWSEHKGKEKTKTKRCATQDEITTPNPKT